DERADDNPGLRNMKKMRAIDKAAQKKNKSQDIEPKSRYGAPHEILPQVNGRQSILFPVLSGLSVRAGGVYRRFAHQCRQEEQRRCERPAERDHQKLAHTRGAWMAG